MPIPLKSLLDAAARTALDLALPMHCLACGREGDLLCTTCIAELPRLEPPFCDTCASAGVVGWCSDCRERARQSIHRIDGIRAPYLLEEPLREAIHNFKYHNVRAAAPLLGRLLADYLEANPLPGDTLAPAPLHHRKLRERGYNQAGLLAKELGKLTGIPVAENLLHRVRNTPPQVHTTSRREREANMADAFASHATAAGRAVILVDDVSTTGSTLAAGAAALKAAGALSVWGLALAKEARQDPIAEPEEPLP